MATVCFFFFKATVECSLQFPIHMFPNTGSSRCSCIVLHSSSSSQKSACHWRHHQIHCCSHHRINQESKLLVALPAWLSSHNLPLLHQTVLFLSFVSVHVKSFSSSSSDVSLCFWICLRFSVTTSVSACFSPNACEGENCKMPRMCAPDCEINIGHDCLPCWLSLSGIVLDCGHNVANLEVNPDLIGASQNTFNTLPWDKGRPHDVCLTKNERCFGCDWIRSCLKVVSFKS